jgi:hypothetical protein
MNITTVYNQFKLKFFLQKILNILSVTWLGLAKQEVNWKLIQFNNIFRRSVVFCDSKYNFRNQYKPFYNWFSGRKIDQISCLPEPILAEFFVCE